MFVLLVVCVIFCFFSCFFCLMLRRPPRSTLDRSSAASDVYKRQNIYRVVRINPWSFAVWAIDQWILITGWRSSNEAPGPSSSNRVPIHPNIRVVAVSYTHLRAHETVLDLVCRLLLEKKKNTKNKKLISQVVVTKLKIKQILTMTNKEKHKTRR